jgi:hypothetical protein
MSLRKRIFRTYLILIILVLIYLLLSLLLGSFRLYMERDKNDILEVKTIWGEMLVSMNETVYNWNDGKTFDIFIANSLLFEKKLSQLIRSRDSGWWYGSEVSHYLQNLYAVWRMAEVNIDRIMETRGSPEFLAAESLLVQEPGLQRLYHIYIRYIESGRSRNDVYAYALKEYIDGVEFFPIYSSTVNYVFVVVLDKVESLYGRISVVQNFLSIVFFILFMLSFVLISSHFTDSISRPITQLNIKLNEFIGKTVERERLNQSDEVAMLEASVDDLIERVPREGTLKYRN